MPTDPTGFAEVVWAVFALWLTTILPAMTLAEAIETTRMHRVVELTSFAEDAAALARQIEQSVVLETLAPDDDKARRRGVIHAGQ